MNKGQIYVFTGDGKGKTSGALGVATRALLIGKEVKWIAFYKQASWGLAEGKIVDKFSNIEMVFGGKGFRIVESKNTKKIEGKKIKIAKVGKNSHVVDTASEIEHVEAIKKTLETATKMLSKKPFLIVIDEILNAVSDGLVAESELIKLIEDRGETHIIVTGRGLSSKIREIADLVTECKKIKHPYDLGKLAIKGLDY